MPTYVLRLNYPPSLASQPILYQLIRQFDLTVNIRQAQITLAEGWLEAAVTGEPEELERAVEWLEAEGVDVVRLD